MLGKKSLGLKDQKDKKMKEKFIIPAVVPYILVTPGSLLS